MIRIKDVERVDHPGYNGPGIYVVELRPGGMLQEIWAGPFNTQYAARQACCQILETRRKDNAIR